MFTSTLPVPDLQEAPVDAALAPRMIADYQVVRALGEGNHGHYYLARPPERLGLDEEFVTLKVFGDRVAEQAYDRGVRELRAFAAVRSEHLVRVYDAVLEDTFVYATEYFPLGSLAAPARPLSRAEVLAALEHTARAAHALHEAGMAHGDITPANVSLSEGPDGTVGGKLSDLGLARFLTPGNTMTGMGRPSSVEFTDPDILAGAVPSRRTEVWSLGATVHRALAGTGLYGELPDSQPLLAIRRVLAKPAQVDDTLADADGALVRDCLAAGDTRLATAEQVAERLAALPR
jgi:eukaryotic-like serine/threonine-protein kinase